MGSHRLSLPVTLSPRERKGRGVLGVSPRLPLAAGQGCGERRNLGVKPPAGRGATACPLCSATFGNAVVELCELAMDRRQNFFLFTCGSCKATLVASMDHVGRVGITMDVSGLSGEFPVIEAVDGGQRGAT